MKHESTHTITPLPVRPTHMLVSVTVFKSVITRFAIHKAYHLHFKGELPLWSSQVHTSLCPHMRRWPRQPVKTGRTQGRLLLSRPPPPPPPLNAVAQFLILDSFKIYTNIHYVILICNHIKVRKSIFTL